MEIRTNMSVPVQPNAVQHPVQQNQAQPAHPAQAEAQIQTPGMREFSNAMTILQTAGAIIQQALNVANRLHNAAQQAMTTGKIDTQEITNSVAEVIVAAIIVLAVVSAWKGIEVGRRQGSSV